MIGKHHYNLRSINHLLVQPSLRQVTDRQPEVEINPIDTDKQNATGNMFEDIFGIGAGYRRRVLADQAA
ncbi:hypothetical protein D3C86_2000870 [compost metagenome]